MFYLLTSQKATFHGQYGPCSFNINNEQYGENRTVGNYLPPSTTHARTFVQMQMTPAPCNFQLPGVGIHPSVITPPDEHAGSSLSNVTMSLSSSENANLQCTYPPPPVPLVYPSCIMPTSLSTTNPKSLPLDGGVNIANGPNIMAPHHSPLAHMGAPQVKFIYICIFFTRANNLYRLRWPSQLAEVPDFRLSNTFVLRCKAELLAALYAPYNNDKIVIYKRRLAKSLKSSKFTFV